VYWHNVPPRVARLDEQMSSPAEIQEIRLARSESGDDDVSKTRVSAPGLPLQRGYTLVSSHHFENIQTHYRPSPRDRIFDARPAGHTTLLLPPEWLTGTASQE
jgi:hypothetical protein